MIEIKVRNPQILGREFSGHILFGPDRPRGFYGICLDHSIVVQGDTLEEAQRNMASALQAFLNHVARTGRVEELKNPSPPEYWERYYRAREMETFQLVRAESKTEKPLMSWPAYRVGGPQSVSIGVAP